MKPLMERDDIQPVILGGDWSSYAIAREFFEAFGVSTYCVAPGAVSVIKKSRFIKMAPVANMGDAEVARALAKIAQAHSTQTVVLMANTDDRVATIERIRDQLSSNVRFQLPTPEAAQKVSDKVSFAELCVAHGLDVARTEVVTLAAGVAPAPTAIPFPVVAKPAVSADYVHLYAKGFKKVYYISCQEELDQLWQDLLRVGYTSDFLVQELIPGDDTYMDSITLYADTNHEIRLKASAHVLLEDHVPELLGNPVAMITTPMPEGWAKLGALLSDIGWCGFANVDIKRDPRDGRHVFLDCNPRIGANSYYVAAAGVNPMYVLVRDIVDGVSETHEATNSILYHRVPTSLLPRYVQDATTRAQLEDLIASKACFNPTRCASDTLAARTYGWAMEHNYIKKFQQHYPEPTELSF